MTECEEVAVNMNPLRRLTFDESNDAPTAWTPDGRGFFYSRFDEPTKGVELLTREGWHGVSSCRDECRSTRARWCPCASR